MNHETFKRRLIDFFERHDKSNIGLVDSIADKYVGKEEQVFTTLNNFYMDKKSGVSREMIEQELTTRTPIMQDNVPGQRS